MIFQHLGNMVFCAVPEEIINQELRVKKTDEIRNYLIEEINRNELMSKKDENVCRVLNYIDHSLIATFTITGCVSISNFASLFAIHIGITGSAIGLRIWVITAGIKRYKSTIKKEEEEAW